MTCLSYYMRARRLFSIASVTLVAGAMCFSVAAAQTTPAVSSFKSQTKDGFRYMSSNGLPFAGSAEAQPREYVFRVPEAPKPGKKAVAVSAEWYFGVALDGVPFDGNREITPDAQGGYVSADGRYFYNAIPQALVSKDLMHVGYAADGHAIFVSRKKLFKPSYDAQGQYVDGSGNLDRCNGAVVNKKYYIYVLTEEYPRVPLCWAAQPDASFRKEPAGGEAVSMPSAGAFNPFPAHIGAGDGGDAGGYSGDSQEAFIQRNIKARSHAAYR